MKSHFDFDSPGGAEKRKIKQAIQLMGNLTEFIQGLLKSYLEYRQVDFE